ncbi:Short-chain dehydrogenase [Chitinophaga terrae (ex Kim and Jung 2007)]|uniref:Short-chain dehydrogenase n=1 Tax=Chitinophaga terrae (ex Kim and Jung 2007) TaxID=408074 RepID=A0A1H4GIW1_9BACT|nr:SDR family oxidoreductase [Chitinophaga terrae (ex Kim and Jung 2007)]MDQ0106579.1 short-subunit dehydrogenase [Chitinophaga terrae (ex Kim and Jung 2007)]GEP93499.1 short chain dehydrogenase [Chitinophaga terrae (ex Kim and Jung 2007)]SEB09504.1 Short-chain dehydrogenase [Chitinophaga terrae (ex Kim and Jung 2007)]
MKTYFQDKVVVITGGSSGIGKALVADSLANGALVAVCGRKQTALDELHREFKSNNLFTFVADVSVEADCKAFIDASLQRFGKIDILVNNAGISMRALFRDLDLKVLKSLMDINFWGTVYCTKYAYPSILANKGTIVGVSSIAGYRGLPARTGYSASKFAMQGFLEALRTENLHTGVNVMWVCPGFTASNIRNTALNPNGEAQSETPLDEGKLMTAEAVATAINKAIAKRKRTLVLTSQGKLTVLLSKLVPGLLDGIVYNHFKKEPGSPLN